MNSTDLNSFRAFLLDQKSLILNKSKAFKNEQASDRDAVPDEAEAASLDLSNTISIHLHERDRMVLFQIERALSKLENGSYGQCECCHDMIGAQRLKASPFATLCIACKEEQEDPRNYLQ